MGWTHHFDEDFAVRYGLNEAIVYQKIREWIRHNAATGRNRIADRTWTYGSRKGLQAQLPFLSEKQIRTALAALREHGLIVAEHHARQPWDRTMWYALADESDIQVLPEQEEEPADEPQSDDPLARGGPEPRPSRAKGSGPEGPIKTTFQEDNDTRTTRDPSPPAPVVQVKAAPPARQKGKNGSNGRPPIWHELGDLTVSRGGHWTNGTAEAVSLDRIIKWAKVEYPDNWERFLRDLFEGIWALHEGAVEGLTERDKLYWAKQPYAPTRILSNLKSAVETLKAIAPGNRRLPFKEYAAIMKEYKIPDAEIVRMYQEEELEARGVHAAV